MSLYLGTNLVAPNSSNSANKDLSNLTDTGKNISNWSSNVSNCITYTPQDIKIELNNGVLTLKAGSKLYYPDGFEQDGTTPKFETITLTNDVVYTPGTSGITSDRFVTYVTAEEGISAATHSESGTSSTATATYTIYYNTAENNCYVCSSSTTLTRRCTLPFLVGNGVNGGHVLDSIKTVFNGFGYIGGTTYALPGVRGLICNGKNDDGSYKSIPFTVENVIVASTYPFNNNVQSYGLLRFDNDNNLIISRSSAVTTYYDINNNIIYRTDGTMPNACMAFETYSSSSVIDGFRIKNVFNAADGNSIDGHWVLKASDIASNVSGDSSYSTTFTVTDLPNDGNSYEIIIDANGRTGTSSGNTCRIFLSSELISSTMVAYAITRTSSYVAGGGSAIIPVGPNRKITMSFSNATGTMTNVYLRMRAYRRLGFGS